MSRQYVVYIHTFPNGKRYVGLTTQSVNSRWRGGEGYKDQFVYKPIKKYGWNNIKHTIYYVNSESEMKYLEKYFFSYYNTTDLRFGYNRTDTSNHPIVSNETKVIISEFAKTRIGNKNPFYGKHHSEETKELMRKKNQNYGTKAISQYTLDGRFIKSYKSIRSAARELNITSSLISSVLSGRQKQTKGYTFKYNM